MTNENNNQSYCLFCKHAYLTKLERTQYRLTGEHFLFEYLHIKNYRIVNHENTIEISQTYHNCDGYEPCP